MSSISGEVTHLTLSLSFKERGPAGFPESLATKAFRENDGMQAIPVRS